MSDKDTLIAMFQRAGIEFTDHPRDAPPVTSAIEIEGGYAGFVTLFEFDESGALKRVSAWE